MDFPTNPFAILTFISAPAVLTNASCMLLFGTGNRYGRAIDRVHELSDTIQKGGAQEDELRLRLRQLESAESRTLLIIRALTFFYGSITGFVASTLISLIGAVLVTTRMEPWRLTLTGGYLFADLPQRSELVHVPLVAVSKTLPMGRFTLADRNRFEKLVGFGSSPIRYRNRILVDLPFGARDRWHVFTDDEIFFDLSASKWNQNRFRAGLGTHLNRRVLLDLYYLQRNPSAGALETRAVGTTLKIELAPREERGEP